MNTQEVRSCCTGHNNLIMDCKTGYTGHDKKRVWSLITYIMNIVLVPTTILVLNSHGRS